MHPFRTFALFRSALVTKSSNFITTILLIQQFLFFPFLAYCDFKKNYYYYHHLVLWSRKWYSQGKSMAFSTFVPDIMQQSVMKKSPKNIPKFKKKTQNKYYNNIIYTLEHVDHYCCQPNFLSTYPYIYILHSTLYNLIFSFY